MRWMWLVGMTGWLVACGGNNTEDTPVEGDTDTDADTDADPDNDADGFAASVDCNDNDASIFPGAADLCDGKDNDCDSATRESGIAFQPGSGSLIDRTAEFEKGSETAPYEVTLDEQGFLNVCEGTWYVSITVEDNVSIRGQGKRASEESVLDGGGKMVGIRVATDDLEVMVENLTLTNFADAQGSGAALNCSGQETTVTASGLRINNNSADVGGAVAATNQCLVSMRTVELQDNSARLGGHVMISQATGQFSDVQFIDGSASEGGGAAVLGTELTNFEDAPSLLRCRDCTFQQNKAESDDIAVTTVGGGAVWVQSEATLEVDGSSFEDNSTEGIGGAVLLQSVDADDAEALFSDTEFDGNTANGVDNDVSIPDVAKGDYDFDDGQKKSLQCDEDDGCS